jgi:hypothetical protein
MTNEPSPNRSTRNVEGSDSPNPNDGRGPLRRSDDESTSRRPDDKSDQAIGRPDEWSEGRYSNADNVTDGEAESGAQRRDESHEIRSTPVTRKDYEQ